MRSSIAKRLLLAIMILGACQPAVAISSLAKNDPYPVYSAIYDPQMTTWSKERIAGFRDCSCYGYEWFAFAVTPFYQKARSGRTFAHEKAFLGDLEGKWNMLALLYGPRPAGTDFTDTPLGFAEVTIFSNLFVDNFGGVPDPNRLLLDSGITREYLLFDETQRKGFFSVPIHYRKMGARFEFSFHPFEDLGLTVQVGVSEIRQTVTGFIDLGADLRCEDLDANATSMGITLTSCPLDDFCQLIPNLSATGTFYLNCDETAPTTTACTTPFCEIEKNLMDTAKARDIFRQIGLDDCNFEETSFEDVRLIGWWRHIFEVNEDRDNCVWPYVLVIPSLEVNGIIPTAKKRDRRKMFALPFGNDGFYSVGFDAGLAFYFVETIEIAFHGGMNHFFGRNVDNYRIPTATSQSGIFPFATNVHVDPGNNFNVNASFHAYRFYDHFSAYVEWVYVKHEQDKIKLRDPAQSSVFLVHDAECLTKFISQFVNASISYEISPNITLALMGQFPVAQRNAYRSTTWLGTFRAVF